MDLATLELDEVIEHTIVDSTGAPTDAVFLLAGPGHPTRIDLDSKLARKSLRQFNKTGKAQLPDDPNVLREQETERMIALTLGWRNVTKNGVDVPFTEDELRAVYENRSMSVRAQIGRALIDIANFTPGSSSN